MCRKRILRTSKKTEQTSSFSSLPYLVVCHRDKWQSLLLIYVPSSAQLLRRFVVLGVAVHLPPKWHVLLLFEA
jgi:hypothetical protein